MKKVLAKLPIIMFPITAACSCGGDGTASSPTEPTSPPSIALPSTFVGKVVFSRVQGSTNVLMAMNPDATGAASLGVQGVKPNVSPDGRKIAYNTLAENIAVLDLTTARETVVATRAIAPRWSPNGKIVFWKLDSVPKDIWVMNADGSGAVRLTNGGGENLEADFSPDGSRIVFRRNTGDGGDLWVMNADGTAASLLYAGDRQDSDARWSPDGTRIAFVRIVPRAQGGGVTSEIFVINQDGSNLVRLTHDGENWSPTWSPDGTRIAFFGYRNGPDDSDLFTVRPDGTDLRLFLGGTTSDHGPAYGPSQ